MTREPDEDALGLDDEALLESYLTKAKDPQDQTQAVSLPDWPPVLRRDINVPVDTATEAWFKRNHSDWRREMAFVLRAWVTAQSNVNVEEAKAPPL